MNKLELAGSGGGEVAELEGSFDNWQSRQRMQRSGKDFTLVKLLPPGVYQVDSHMPLIYFLVSMLPVSQVWLANGVVLS